MRNSIGEILRKLRENEEVSEDELLLKMSNGNTIFEYAIKNNRNIICNSFKKTKSLDIILESERYDLLSQVDISVLLKVNRKDLNKKYIETILELHKNNKRINISFNPFDEGCTLSNAADLYIIYAKAGLIDYLPLLDEELLLMKTIDKSKDSIIDFAKEYFLGYDNRKSFLELLLDRDEELTTEEILSKSIKTNFDIAMILRTYNIYQPSVEYDLQSNNFISNLIGRINKQYKDIVLTKEENDLLNMLYNLFIDGSDPKAIEALINSYKIQISKKNPNTLREIKQLIALKLDGKPESIKIGGSFYQSNENRIEISNNITDTINHEMGHALFHNLTDGSVPEEFWHIIKNVRNKASTLRKVKEYSDNQSERVKEVKKWTSEKYDRTYTMMNKILEMYKLEDELKKIYDWEKDNRRAILARETLSVRKKIKDYLEKAKEEKIDIYLKKGYTRDVLETLFKNSFTVREYARMHKRIQKREFAEAINSSYFAPARAIGDIIDGIFRGNFFAGNLYYAGDKITPIAGHGIFYYNYDKNTVFDEMLANYRTIMMSENSEEYLKDLRYYVGDELVDFLNSFYNNMILSNQNKKGDSYGR